MNRLSDVLPLSPGLWKTASSIASYLTIGAFVPRLLLEERIGWRQLMPGAVLFAGVMLGSQPIVDRFFPRALETSATHYGSIGVAFTYISYLYVFSFVYLACACVGRVTVADQGWLGQWLRRERPLLARRHTNQA